MASSTESSSRTLTRLFSSLVWTILMFLSFPTGPLLAAGLAAAGVGLLNGALAASQRTRLRWAAFAWPVAVVLVFSERTFVAIAGSRPAWLGWPVAAVGLLAWLTIRRAMKDRERYLSKGMLDEDPDTHIALRSLSIVLLIAYAGSQWFLHLWWYGSLAPTHWNVYALLSPLTPAFAVAAVFRHQFRLAALLYVLTALLIPLFYPLSLGALALAVWCELAALLARRTHSEALQLPPGSVA